MESIYFEEDEPLKSDTIQICKIITIAVVIGLGIFILIIYPYQ